MPSARQLAANRANALKSTGPRTPEGKARGAENGRKSTGPKTAEGKRRAAANTLHSTGPRTAAGKMRAARNSLRHGLTLPVEVEACPQIGAFARAIVGDAQDADCLTSACGIARAQFDLRRIARARLALLPAASAGDPEALDQIVRLERYERRAWAQRTRAVRAYDAAASGLGETPAPLTKRTEPKPI